MINLINSINVLNKQFIKIEKCKVSGDITNIISKNYSVTGNSSAKISLNYLKLIFVSGENWMLII